jgi:hypothetical protein
MGAIAIATRLLLTIAIAMRKRLFAAAPFLYSYSKSRFQFTNVYLNTCKIGLEIVLAARRSFKINLMSPVDSLTAVS